VLGAADDAKRAKSTPAPAATRAAAPRAAAAVANVPLASRVGPPAPSPSAATAGKPSPAPAAKVAVASSVAAPEAPSEVVVLSFAEILAKKRAAEAAASPPSGGEGSAVAASQLTVAALEAEVAAALADTQRPEEADASAAPSPSTIGAGFAAGQRILGQWAGNADWLVQAGVPFSTRSSGRLCASHMSR
jgi:hypothetical protein